MSRVCDIFCFWVIYWQVTPIMNYLFVIWWLWRLHNVKLYGITCAQKLRIELMKWSANVMDNNWMIGNDRFTLNRYDMNTKNYRSYFAIYYIPFMVELDVLKYCFTVDRKQVDLVFFYIIVQESTVVYLPHPPLGN